MNLIKKNLFYLVFAILLFSNVAIFISSMYLGDEVNRFDSETKQLTQENAALEKEVYQAQSLQYAASLSAGLNFTKQSQPVFFENLKYALNR